MPNPLISPLTSPSLTAEINRLHTLACQNKQATYKDPATGSDVFTEFYLRERGSCCESGCRHCPWGLSKQDQ